MKSHFYHQLTLYILEEINGLLHGLYTRPDAEASIIAAVAAAPRPCVCTCALSSDSILRLRTDSSDSGSASACRNGCTHSVCSSGKGWTSRSQRPWWSPASDVGVCARLPCWCPCRQSRTWDSGSETLCSEWCL